jgi:hypothetical protein
VEIGEIWTFSQDKWARGMRRGFGRLVYSDFEATVAKLLNSDYLFDEDAAVSKIGPPTFTLKSIWQKAIAAGFPTNAIATIRYSSQGVVIEIPNTKHKLTFDPALRQVPNKETPNCSVIINGK